MQKFHDKEYKIVKKALKPISELLEDPNTTENMREAVTLYSILELLESFDITLQLGILERTKWFLTQKVDIKNPSYLV